MPRAELQNSKINFALVGDGQSPRLLEVLFTGAVLMALLVSMRFPEPTSVAGRAVQLNLAYPDHIYDEIYIFYSTSVSYCTISCHKNNLMSVFACNPLQ